MFPAEFQVLFNRNKLLKPSDIPGLRLWFTADPANVQLNGATSVSLWRNKAGYYGDASQANASKQPDFAIDAATGEGFITGGGLKYLGLDIPVPASNLMTCFIVYKHPVSAGARCPIAGDSNSWEVRIASTNYTLLKNNISTIQTLSITPVGYTIGCFQGNNAISRCGANGTMVDGTTAPTITQPLTAMFINTHAMNEPTDFPIKAILWYERELSVVERQKVEGYLARQFPNLGLVAKLPAGHPYISAPPKL